jgi:hypothetical protein
MFTLPIGTRSTAWMYRPQNNCQYNCHVVNELRHKEYKTWVYVHINYHKNQLSSRTEHHNKINVVTEISQNHNTDTA